MTSNDLKPQLLTRQEASKRLGIRSKTTMYRLLINGELIGAFQIKSGHWRVPESAIRDYIDRHQRSSQMIQTGEESHSCP